MVLFSLFAAGRKRETVPIFALGTVLFPGAILPLKIFEVRYIDMAKECLKAGSPFGVCLIREGEESGRPRCRRPCGCFARIADCDVEDWASSGARRRPRSLPHRSRECVARA